LERKDSYFEHLAGKFFPPDAHDFEGKERAKALMLEVTKNYDEYWKERYLPKDLGSSQDLVHGTIAEWDAYEQPKAHEHNLLIAPVQRLIPKPRAATAMPKIRIRPTSSQPKKRQTSANLALRMTRVLAATPVAFEQPQLQRPFTAIAKTTSIVNRPQTSL
jgi:hypothetical protein